MQFANSTLHLMRTYWLGRNIVHYFSIKTCGIITKLALYFVLLIIFDIHPAQITNKEKLILINANSGGRGFESHRGQKFVFHILTPPPPTSKRIKQKTNSLLTLTFYSIRVECKELFCKTNKNLKINRKKIISSEMTTFYWKVKLVYCGYFISL